MTVPAPRAGVLEIAPYVGGESDIEGVENIAKLSSNENALGPSPRAVEAFSRHRILAASLPGRCCRRTPRRYRRGPRAQPGTHRLRLRLG